MLLYLSIFLIPLFYYFASRSNPSLKTSRRACFMLFMFLGFFVGLGDMQGGYDRYIYGAYFDEVADNIRGNLIWRTYGSEWGYSFFNWLVAHFTQNRYIFILIATLTMFWSYYQAFKKYIEDYPLAMIVFMGLLYYFTMTYLRQTLAVGFAWQACRYAYERKPLPFFLWLLLAFSFHNSAIIFAAMYFVPLKKFNRSTVWGIMFIMFIIGLTPIASWAMNTFGDVSNSAERTDSYADDMGYNFAYLFVSIAFAWIMVSNSHLIRNTKKDVFFYNMGLMYCAVLLAMIRFGQTGRLGWFYMLGLIYTMSAIASRSSSRGYMRTFIIGLSFLMFFRITNAWNFNLSPYKTFLSNGYPCGERYIYDENEYDDMYTLDKLYRPTFNICTNLDLQVIKSKYHE